MTSYKLAKVRLLLNLFFQSIFTPGFQQQAMGIFYRDQLRVELSWKEQLVLFEYWHAINILSDLCTAIGTVLVIRLDRNYDCDQVWRSVACR